MNIYLGGPMRGIPNFNFPAFHKAAALMRSVGYKVFNPAEKDEKTYGKAVSKSKTGSIQEATQKHGFSLRKALASDTRYICLKADGIALLPGWETSKGACAELALAKALDLKIYLFDKSLGFFKGTALT